MTKTDRVILFIIAIASLTACSGRPSGVLGKEDMAQLLADIHIGESAMTANSRRFATDSAKRAFLQSIYLKHGVTKAEVDSSFSWYGYHIEKYMEVTDRTVEILEERLEKAQEIAGSSAQGIAEVSLNFEGDSVDVWPGVRNRRFSSSMPNDFITFSLTNDRNWENGDVYTLRSKIIDNHSPLVYTIAVDYNNGEREYLSRTISGYGWHDMQFALDSARSAQRVYGIISYAARPGETVYIDSITLMRTRWGGHYRDARQSVKTFTNRTRQGASGSAATPTPTPPPSKPLTPVEGKLDGTKLQNIPLKPGQAPVRPGQLHQAK